MSAVAIAILGVACGLLGAAWLAHEDLVRAKTNGHQQTSRPRRRPFWSVTDQTAKERKVLLHSSRNADFQVTELSTNSRIETTE